MGKIKQGVLGGFTGTVGPVIGSSWKGVDVVKSKPTSVAYPATAGQVAQTSKMAGIVAIGSELLAGVVKPLWDRFAVKQSGYNAFTSANIGNMNGASVSDFSAFKIAKGKLLPLTPACDGVPVLGELVVTWDDVEVSDPLASATDVAFAVILGEDSSVVGFASGTTRASKEISIPAKSLGAMTNVNVYLAFRSADGKRVSNTGYANVLLD